MLRIYPHSSEPEPVVITGIGLITANGLDRESAWQATRQGVSGIRLVDEDSGVPNHLRLAADVPVVPEFDGQLKVIQLGNIAANEAMNDAGIDLNEVDADRFGCAVSAHVGDVTWFNKAEPSSFEAVALEQWLPHSLCSNLANRFGLLGPRSSHSTACASGLIDLISAVRDIKDGQCDIALTGSSEAIHPLFAAGFQRMRVLANDDDPEHACLPFDRRRHGFVMGEGAGMFVIESLSHALGRGAKIYAEILGGRVLADAHHVTDLDVSGNALKRLITDLLATCELDAADVGYINAHGTGTEQNDLLESRGIRAAFGASADDVCVSSLKAILGHLVTASGSVELGMTVLGMRDGFAPPTLNLTDRDPRCDLDFVPMVGRDDRYQHAMKLSLAFGGHLVGAIVRRWNDTATGFAYPQTPSQPMRKAA